MNTDQRCCSSSLPFRFLQDAAVFAKKQGTMPVKSIEYRLAPTALIDAARAVVRDWKTGDLTKAVRELAAALEQLKATSPPILGVVVRSGQVESLISDRADIIQRMLQDVIVIYSGNMVIRATAVRVTDEAIGLPGIDLNDLMRDLVRGAAEEEDEP